MRREGVSQQEPARIPPLLHDVCDRPERAAPGLDRLDPATHAGERLFPRQDPRVEQEVEDDDLTLSEIGYVDFEIVAVAPADQHHSVIWTGALSDEQGFQEVGVAFIHGPGMDEAHEISGAEHDDQERQEPQPWPCARKRRGEVTQGEDRRGDQEKRQKNGELHVAEVVAREEEEHRQKAGDREELLPPSAPEGPPGTRQRQARQGHREDVESRLKNRSAAAHGGRSEATQEAQVLGRRAVRSCEEVRIVDRVRGCEEIGPDSFEARERVGPGDVIPLVNVRHGDERAGDGGKQRRAAQTWRVRARE